MSWTGLNEKGINSDSSFCILRLTGAYRSNELPVSMISCGITAESVVNLVSPVADVDVQSLQGTSCTGLQIPASVCIGPGASTSDPAT